MLTTEGFHRTVRGAAASVAFWVLAWSAVAEASPPRAAVVALDEVAWTQNLVGETARALQPTGLAVLHGEELDEWVQRSSQGPPDPEILAEFAPATETIAQGVERFFYMSPDRAIGVIQPVFDLGVQHPEVLAYRNDLADQIWQGGIVLVRAYAESGKGDEALLQATRLVGLFPSREVDERVVPPETRKVVEAAREAISGAQSTLRISVPDPARCTPYLNGLPAKVQSTYAVDPTATYYVRTDCSKASPPPTWQVRVPKGTDAEVFSAPIPPQQHRTDDLTSTEERRRIEWYLQSVARQAGVDTVVGVAATGSRDNLVLVRFDTSKGSMIWSDSDYGETVRRSLPRIFPEYAEAFASPDVADSAPRSEGPDILGIVLVGAGAASAGVGTYLLVSASRQARRLDCAVNNPSPPSGVDCEGSERLEFDDFSSEQQKVGAVRAGGVSMLGVGAVAIGYGVFRLLRRPSKEDSAVAFRFPAAVEIRW